MRLTLRSSPRGLTLAFFLLFLGVGCVPPRPPETGPSARAAEKAAQEEKKEEDEKEAFEPWDKALKDTGPIEGYFTLHLKRDGKLFLEVPPERLEEEFGLVMHYSRGVGDFNVQQGLPLSEGRLMRLRRVADKIQLIHLNPRFVADPGSPMERAAETNVGHSVVAAWDIKSEHDSTKHLLVDITKWVVSDYARVSDRLAPYYADKGVSLDADRSHVGQVLGFPRNVEVDAELTYSAGGFPRFGGFGVSDHRSIPVGVRYSIFALPEEPMRPRLADDRVGYFLTAHWDFSRDRKEVPYVRYVNRWRLEKADPTAAASEPVKPIVFYVDHSVPLEYRRYVREGIEAWNKAFERAGFRNAIVARDAPEDSAWSAEDVRYSTVRWTPSYSMGYAIGPSQVDPRTGEILNADILISANFPRFWQLRYRDFVGRPFGAGGVGPAFDPAAGGPLAAGRPAGGPGADGTPGPAGGVPRGGLEGLMAHYEETRWLAATLPPHLAEHLCTAADGKAHQAALGYALLLGLGEATVGEMPEEYVGDAMRDLVMHEVGHTLGLRHNFKASSGIPHERLNDTEFTRRHGLSLSVMDYGPVNVSPDRSRQGHYWNKEVGSYDVWAIRYGYATIYEQPEDGSSVTSGTPATDPEAELPELRKIASQAADPLHTYGTDEDTHLGSYAVDPLSNTWDLGSDPLHYAEERARIVSAVTPRLEERLIAEGEGYQRLRGATTSLLFERFVSLMPVTKKVGGLYFARDHKGDPGGRVPFTPVPAERQREAVRLLVDQALREDSFRFDPELLNRLAPNRYSHWGTGFIELPVDYPVHSYVLLIQRALLYELLAPARLWRLIDTETRVRDGGEPYRASELFRTLTGAVWSELGLDEGGRVTGRARSVSSFRRNLQRAHLERLVQLLLDRTTGFPAASAPEDARSLARQELVALSGRIGQVLRTGGLDAMTRAHLAESRARIDRALEASLELSEP